MSSGEYEQWQEASMQPTTADADKAVLNAALNAPVPPSASVLPPEIQHVSPLSLVVFTSAPMKRAVWQQQVSFPFCSMSAFAPTKAAAFLESGSVSWFTTLLSRELDGHTHHQQLQGG